MGANCNTTGGLQVEVYGAAAVVVFVVVMKDAGVLDVEAGVRRNAQQTHQQPLAAPPHFRRLSRDNVQLYPAHAPRCSWERGCVGWEQGTDAGVYVGYFDVYCELEPMRTEEKYLFRGVVVYRGIALF